MLGTGKIICIKKTHKKLNFCINVAVLFINMKSILSDSLQLNEFFSGIEKALDSRNDSLHMMVN